MKLKLGIGKKLIGAHGIGLVFFLFLAIFSYVSLNSYSSIQKKTDELANKTELISDLQLLISKILMPPNDYLITGDKNEREGFAGLVTQTASLFEKIRISRDKTKEDIAILEDIEKGFIELQKKAMVLLSTENPVGNKEAARLMEEMDAFADDLIVKVEKLRNLIRIETEGHKKSVSEISKQMVLIFLSLTFISLSGMVVIALIIMKGVIRPIAELTNGVKAIGSGNLEHRIKIETGDEIEGLGNEFNSMAQSLKEKVAEVKEYSEKLERTNRQLDQNILQLYTLYNISKTISATFEMEKLLNQVVERVSEAMKLHRINVMLVNEDRTEMYIVAGMGMPERAMEIRFNLGGGYLRLDSFNRAGSGF
ncbi:MAG: HAMP domain-containing protein [Deltaproteobacteria bacterium]|nr:HAMP domain-containing protein [Deltaproteobacteria bacterium]